MSETEDKPRRRAPPITFSEFILSMGTNAAMLLGGDDGVSIPSAADLAQASQHIDIITMLKDKTAGNLDKEEQSLIDALLYDLRMKYLEVASAQK